MILHVYIAEVLHVKSQPQRARDTIISPCTLRPSIVEVTVIWSINEIPATDYAGKLILRYLRLTGLWAN